MARVSDALAAFGDCVPHLRERAEDCLGLVDPLAPDPRVYECEAMLDSIFKEARRDAVSVADRRQREAPARAPGRTSRCPRFRG